MLSQGLGDRDEGRARPWESPRTGDWSSGAGSAGHSSVPQSRDLEGLRPLEVHSPLKMSPGRCLGGIPLMKQNLSFQLIALGLFTFLDQP